MANKTDLTHEDYSQLTAKKKEFSKENNKWKGKHHHRHPRDIVIALGACTFNSNLEIFNIRTNNWTLVPYGNQPGTVSGHGLVVVGHNLYQVGGRWTDHEGEPLDRMESLDLLEGRWTSRRAMAMPRHGLTTVVWRGCIVAFGGTNYDETRENYDTALRLAEIYDPGQDSWRNFPSLTTERTGAAGVVVDDRIFAIGGESSNNTEIDSIEYFNPVTNRWTVCGSLKNVRATATAVVYEDRVFVFGGRDSEALGTGECFKPVMENGNMCLVWFEVPDLPWKRADFNICVVDNKIMFNGGDPEGQTGGYGMKSCDLFCPKTLKWSKMKDMHKSRSYHKTVTVNTTDIGLDWTKEIVKKLQLNSPIYLNSDFDSADEYSD